MPAEVEELQQPQLSVREPQSKEELAACYEMYIRTLRGPWIVDPNRPDKKTLLVGAWLGELLTGVGSLHFDSREEARIRWMIVEDVQRRKGIGSAILAQLEHVAVDRGAVRLTLRTTESTLGYFIMRGFEIRQPPSVLFDSVPHWDMKKPLPPALP